MKKCLTLFFFTFCSVSFSQASLTANITGVGYPVTFSITPGTLGGVTVLGSLPVGTNTIGGVSLMGPLSASGVSLLAGVANIGGVSVLAPVTVAFVQTPIPKYWSQNSNSVSVIGSAVTLAPVTYLFNSFSPAMTIIGGSGAVDFAWYGNTNPNGNSFVSWGAVTISGANATTYFYVPTPGYSMMLSIFSTSASTTETGLIRATQ